MTGLPVESCIRRPLDMMIKTNRRHSSCIRFLVPLLLVLQAACVGNPKQMIFTPEEFAAEVSSRLEGDSRPVRVEHDDFLDTGRELYTIEVDVLRPPYLLDQAARERIVDCVGYTGSDQARLMQLRDCVINRPSRIRYNSTLTLDAAGCLELQEGNCFALTNLFVGAAREAGFRSWYVLVEDVITNRAVGQQVFHINHIVSGLMVNSGQRLVDFIPNPREYHVQTPLSDIEAAGLFYNNLGAALMVDDEQEGAEYLLGVAERLYPESYQVQNNLGLLHRRRGDLDAAREAFERAFTMARFPDLVMGNLLNLYRETGDADRAEDLRRQLGRVSRRNPYFYLALAREAFAEEDHQATLELLGAARRINRRIPAIYVLECELWEALDKPRRLKRARKKLGRLLVLEGGDEADLTAERNPSIFAP